MPDDRTTSLVIVNLNGEEHLRGCLDSVAGLDLDGGRVETLLVDNASTDGSLELVRGRYPWVRVLRQSENLGFAAGANIGAEAATGDYLALCNNDMRLDRGWLRELLAVRATAADAPCVAGVILDWEGQRVDFVGGFVNLHGFAGQERFGDRLEDVALEDGRSLPFPCGGSMLVDRELFLELGGFDARFFALLEDVDFGWRLRLAGHDVRLAARARSYHRHGATTGALASDERLFLFERNALRMLLKNVGDPNLPRFLAFALFLLAERAALAGDGKSPGLRAVANVAENLEEVLAERKRVQALRRRSDAEVVEQFGRPFLAVNADERYLTTAALLARLFGLDELAREQPRADGELATEELRQLLDVWRDRYGIGVPVWRRAARALRRALR